jgi:hypothetical protein
MRSAKLAVGVWVTVATVLIICPFTSAAPIVTNVTVTDVTPVSFSVVWAADVPSTSGVNVFSDPDGTSPVPGVSIESQPVESGDSAIAVAAEDLGVMKVRVSGLQPNTTYYYQTVTTAKPPASGVTLFPAAAPMGAVTTENNIVRTRLSWGADVPFANDLLVFDCDVAGALLVAEVQGADYPVSGFGGDGLASPVAYVDLNNAFRASSHETMPTKGESVTLTKFKGSLGTESTELWLPGRTELAQISSPSDVSGCDGDFNADGDVDGGDLATFAAVFGRTDCTSAASCPGDFDEDGDVDGGDLAKFAAHFGRTNCP